MSCLLSCSGAFPSASTYSSLVQWSLADLHLQCSLRDPVTSPNTKMMRVVSNFILELNYWCVSQLAVGQQVSQCICMTILSYVFSICAYVSSPVRVKSWCCPPEWAPSRSHQLSMQGHCKMTQWQSALDAVKRKEPVTKNIQRHKLRIKT